METRTLKAKWEAKGGKSYAELYEFNFKGTPAFELTGTYGYCNLGNAIKTLEQAIAYLEKHTIACIKMDYPSLKKVI